MNNFDLKVGFDCNHNCVHCVVSESAKYGSLSYDQIRRVTNDIPKEDSVTLTGGEPTIRPDFLSIVDLFKRHSHINIQTNGTGITEEVCQKLKRYPVHVLLTIHSVDKETYDKTARCPDSSYDKATEAAKCLTRHNINFTWQIVVHTLNKDTVFDSFLFAKSINNKILLKLTYPDPAGNADDKALLCSYAELRPVLERVIDEFKTSMSFEGFPLCIVKNHAKYFNEARLKKESYGLNFENDATVCKYNMKNRYAYVDACDVCSVKNRCRGIYKKYVEYFGCKEFEPVESNFTTEYKFQNFFLWVFVTRQCNRNCEYCKQGTPIFEHEYITEENLRYVLDECVKIHENKIVNKISFEVSGGEPFLAFNTFSKVIPEYKKYSFLHFSSATNGTIINDQIIQYIRDVYNGSICISVDDIAFSKPLNGVSSSSVQLENIKKLREAGIRISCISVFDTQESMMPMAEYATENFCHWRILLAKPIKHTKEQILTMAKPVLKYLFDRQMYTARFFDFDGWDLWNRRNCAGCPCGRRLLGILPNLEVIPNNGESNPPKLGKFNADLLSLLESPANYYYKNDCRPAICNDCVLKNECDGGCRLCHSYTDKLKERCDALKELMNYVWELK